MQAIMAVNRKYSVDLAGHMAECEANYARIMQLYPDMASVDWRELGIELAATALTRFTLLVTQRGKYTTELSIRPRPAAPNSAGPDSSCEGEPVPAWPYFLLRIYHDAQMAEVIACNQYQRVQPRYDYPNNNMYHPDEKAQWNRFLGEWLSHCLHYGCVLDSPIFAVSREN
jgi:uncharacterized protein YqiB (DUF1249 family)